MKLSTFQHARLRELGITQWQLRADAPAHLAIPPNTDVDKLESNEKLDNIVESTPPARVDLCQSQDPFVMDVKSALASDFRFKWYEGEQFDISETILVTPPLAELKSSPQAKQQLWQVLLAWLK